MSIYQKIANIGQKTFGLATTMKYAFNLSPMYRRSTGRVIEVTDDLLRIKIKIRLSYKNRNYVNTIFGGSMFSAVDPIPMVQLINLLGKEYAVWDKSAEVYFKRPAKEDLYAEFDYTLAELESIKQRIRAENEIEITKHTQLTNKDKSVVYCEVIKKIYIADKAFYMQKKAKRT